MEELKSLEDLLDLQVVDLEIDRLLHRRQNLPELTRYRAAHEDRTAAARRVDEAEAAHKQVSLALDKAEGELTLLEQKKNIEERRLYAGGLGARETEHLRQEVVMLGKQATAAEEEIIELMERREVQETELAALREELAAAEAAEKDLEAQVTALWKEIDAELARKEARKAGLVPMVDTDLLELYEHLRPSREDGVAVGRFAEGICGGCHLRLSAAEQHEVLKEYPPRCLHCLRILVPQPR